MQGQLIDFIVKLPVVFWRPLLPSRGTCSHMHHKCITHTACSIAAHNNYINNTLSVPCSVRGLFEYVSTAIINILPLLVRGLTLDVRISRLYRRQILTPKVCPRTERVKYISEIPL